MCVCVCVKVAPLVLQEVRSVLSVVREWHTTNGILALDSPSNDGPTIRQDSGKSTKLLTFSHDMWDFLVKVKL